MLLVVGLGNPGREYASHRHNVGFMAVDDLARRINADAFREKFSGEMARGEIAGEPAILLKPQTFMNLSGQCVQPAMAFFKVAPAEVIVLHDELDIPFGEVRLKMGGGHAGHNGLRSLIERLGTPEFGRVRIGVGRPPPGFRGEVADYVLSSFDTTERAALPELIKQVGSAVLDVGRRGFGPAMNARNTRPKPAKPKPAAPGPGTGVASATAGAAASGPRCDGDASPAIDARPGSAAGSPPAGSPPAGSNSAEKSGKPSS